MTRLASLLLLALAFPACLASTDDVTGEEPRMSEEEIRRGPEPAPPPVLDCADTANAKCWECGYSGDDVQDYCCRDVCDVINKPPEPPPEAPVNEYPQSFTYDPYSFYSR